MWPISLRSDSRERLRSRCHETRAPRRELAGPSDGGSGDPRPFSLSDGRIALDDFGAGYSSLRYLDRLPVDVVKIDRSFIASLDNPDKRATLLAITQLLDTMNVRTVAEGVETTTQLEYVGSLGIHACQGFLFSRPVPAADLLDAVRLHSGATQTPLRLPEPAGAPARDR
jgi:predicted signal transduction protein with EAL and GGDEF domain